MFDWTQAQAAIDPKIGFVVLGLWAIGFFLKKTPKVEDWLILYVLLIFGIAGAIGILGFTIYAVVQGVIAAAIAALGHQLIKQTTEKRVEDQASDI